MSETEPDSDSHESEDENTSTDWNWTDTRQPMPDTWGAKLLRAPGLRSLPILGQSRENSLDIVPVTRAFKHSHAIEHEDGGVIGAVRVRPAPMAMNDDIDPAIHQFAANLTALKASKGMLIDIPRDVDYGDRRRRFRELADRLSDRAEEGGDRHLALQADLAAERASVENFYETTTTTHDHLIVIKVDQVDAVEVVADASVEGGLAKIPGLGTFVKERRKEKLAGESELTRIMNRVLESRLGGLEKYMNYLDGIEAQALPSTEFSELISDHFRGEDMQSFDDFGALVKGVPVPGRSDPDAVHDGDLRHDTKDGKPLVTIGDGPESDEAVARYRHTLAPDPLRTDPSGNYIELGERERSATIEVTEWPKTPARGFLDPIYDLDMPGVDITVATHFERRGGDEIKREAKQQENSLLSMYEDNEGGAWSEYYERKLEEAEDFSDGLEATDYDAFDVGLYLQVSMPRSQDEAAKNQGYAPREETEDIPSLEDAIEEVMITLKEDCGFDRNDLRYGFESGLRTTSPTCTNDLGTNVTVRADGVARQFPYSDDALQEEGGVRIGIHEYSREPVVPNIFDRENGYDGGLYAMKGSGKTTTLQEIAVALKLQYMSRDEDLNLVLSTPLQDFDSICEAFDGKHVVVGGETGVNPLETAYLPPEVIDDVGEDAPWKTMLDRAMAFLGSYYDQEGKDNWGTKQSKWKRAIKEANYRVGITPEDPETYKKESPTLREVEDVLVDMVNNPGEYVKDDLKEDKGTKEKWADTCREIVNQDLEGFQEDGQYSHFCKPTTIDFDENDVIYLDLQRYESDERGGGLMMQMLLSDLYEQAKQSTGKTFFGIDEFHYMLKSGRDRQFWKQTSRHARHWDLAVWVSTQEFGDLFTESEDGEAELTDSMQTMFNQQAMQLYQYNKEMNPEWGDELDLSRRSQRFIREAQPGDASEGFAQGLFVVDEEEFPIRIEMHDDLNPRSFALYQHDGGDASHPDTWTWLQQYAEQAGGDDPCEWTWPEIEDTSEGEDGQVADQGQEVVA